MRLSLIFSALAMGTLACGCAAPDRVTAENYSTIRANSHSAADVEAILGPPDSKLVDMWVYQRPDQHVTVLIDFDGHGRVARKQWVDGKTGAWDDTNDKPKP